jgi:hypothetical protein
MLTVFLVNVFQASTRVFPVHFQDLAWHCKVIHYLSCLSSQERNSEHKEDRKRYFFHG